MQLAQNAKMYHYRKKINCIIAHSESLFEINEQFSLACHPNLLTGQAEAQSHRLVL